MQCQKLKTYMETGRVVFLPARSIRPNPAQPRKIFRPEALDELSDSIRQHGILQPLSVRRSGNGYELIAGERRLRAAELAGLPGAVKLKGAKTLCETLGVGEPTLNDIVAELCKPGRDVRDSLPKPLLRSDVMGLDDLKPGMELTGTVRNVIDFGVFVDIGVHQDGLVHISEVCDRRLRHPSEVVKVGDVVKVVVLNVDKKRHRIGLSMKQAK